MRKLVRLTALIATVALLGCAPASERDLVGTWQIMDDSRKLLPEEFQQAAGKFTLASDGTFVAVELPASVVVSGTLTDGVPLERKPTLLTASGDWELRQVAAGSYDTVVLSSIKAVSRGGTGDLRYGYSLFVQPVFRGYRLVDHWGDPDAVPGFLYSKTEATGVRRGS